MFEITAANSASFQIELVILGSVPTVNLETIRRYQRMWWSTPTELGQVDELPLQFPSAMPEWLFLTQDIIKNSVLSDPSIEENDGSWLSQDVANAATDFFRDIADLLPGEPFLYPSKRGDLVAEFESNRGTLTSIISPSSVLLFKVQGAVAAEKKITDLSELRSEAEPFTRSLLPGTHGDLDPTE